MTLYLNQSKTLTVPRFTTLLAKNDLSTYLKIRELGNLVYMDMDVNDSETHKIYNHYYSVYNDSYETAKLGATYIGRSTYDFSTPTSISNVKSGNTYFRISNTETDIVYKDPHMCYNVSDGDSKPWYLYFEDRTSKTIKMIKSADIAFWYYSDMSTMLTGTGTGTLWEKKDVTGPLVIYDVDTWYMFYCARKSRGISGIKYATSTDGLTWTKQSNIIDPTICSWTDRFSPDDIIKIGSTYYMTIHGYISDSVPATYGYTTNDASEYWGIGILSSSSLTSGWTDYLGDYYKPFGTTDYDYKIVGGQGMFFVKNTGSSNVSHMYYNSDNNTDTSHNGITLLDNPTTDNDTYETMTRILDSTRYNKSS